MDGRERTVLARVPAGASAAPRDLVIAFHGRTVLRGPAVRAARLA